MTSRQATPLAVALLGYGGLIPFAAGALATVLPGFVGAELAFTIYAVAILSFLGGIQWGLVMVSPAAGYAVERLVAGVLAPLVAVAAILLGSATGLVLLLIGFVALFAWEGLRRSDVLPSWYLGLRLRLTSGVVICLLIVLAGRI